MRQSLGTLVGAPRLPAFLVAPSAALLTGLLEGAYFWSAQMARGAAAVVTLNEGEADEARAVLGPSDPPALGDEELPLVAARAALSGAYLSLEATLTGSLWLAVGTSAAGLVTAMLLSRRGGASNA